MNENRLIEKVAELQRLKKEIKDLQKEIDRNTGFRLEPATKYVWERGTEAHCCMFLYQSYPDYMDIPEEHKEKSRRWYRFVEGRTREECIENIKKFIDKLTEFYNGLEAEAIE